MPTRTHKPASTTVAHTSGTPSTTDGMLAEWGARLFYPALHGKPQKDPDERLAKTTAQQLLWRNLSGRAMREHIRSAITPGAKEVMVKITGGGRGMKAIAAHFRYISRLGKPEAGGRGQSLELEDELGLPIQGKEDLANLMQDWRLAGSYIPDDSPRKEAHNIILSMPEGTPPEHVRDAAREFAQDNFDGHKWVMVLHTDTPRPHVHLAVRIERSDGHRLYPGKAELQRWREHFARSLQDRGVNAVATPARARGQTRRPQPLWQQRDTQRATRPAKRQRTAPSQVQDRQQAQGAWREIAKALKASADSNDRKLGEEVERYAADAYDSARQTPGLGW